MSKKNEPKVTFIQDLKSLPVPEKKLLKVIEDISDDFEELTEKEFNIIFCSDYRIRKLNCEYRNKPKVTDVLSFPFNEKDFMGEIYISLNRVVIQSERYELTYEEELIRLMVHGVFHLLGYDHQNEIERLEMESFEKKYNSMWQ